MINGIFGIFSILNLHIQLEATQVTKYGTVSHNALSYISYIQEAIRAPSLCPGVYYRTLNHLNLTVPRNESWDETFG